jgi:hypothetical protein
MSFAPSNIPYGQTFIKTWRSPTGFEHHQRAVDNIILVSLAASENGISSNASKEIPLNLGFHYQVLSLWTDMTSNADDSLTVRLKKTGNLVQEFVLSASAIPFEFPFLCLDGTIGYTLEVTPTQSIDNFWLFIRPLVQLSKLELIAI